MDEPLAIDINCDVGEGAGNEKNLFPFISSCNIACGGHAGSMETMSAIVRLAKLHGVKIGAHPSYPDKENFGRVSMHIPFRELEPNIQQQIANLQKICIKYQVGLNHIKAHGALYNDLAKSRQLSKMYLDSIKAYRPKALLYVPYASEIAQEALLQGFKIKYEAFADRNYTSDLGLVPRKSANALLKKPEEIINHMLEMIKYKTVCTHDGKHIKILAETFCIHSDTPAAYKIVLYLSKELPNHKINIQK